MFRGAGSMGNYREFAHVAEILDIPINPLGRTQIHYSEFWTSAELADDLARGGNDAALADEIQVTFRPHPVDVDVGTTILDRPSPDRERVVRGVRVHVRRHRDE